jgi:hypothetical protein
VLVPEGSHNFSTAVDSKGKYLQFYIGEYGEDGDDLGGELKITDDSRIKTNILGKATDLTEEQCAGIVSPLWNGFINYLLINEPVGNYKRLVKSTAKDSFSSLMESMVYYSVNPFDEPFCEDGCRCSDQQIDDCKVHLSRWQEAQASTGSWLILQKL